MKTLVDLLNDAYHRHSDKVAFMFNNETLSYRELHDASNDLALTLQDLGVNKGDRVCFYFHKSFESIISIYAILKLGAIYIPLDPLSPIDRLRKVLKDVNAKAIIHSRTLSNNATVLNETVNTICYEYEYAPYGPFNFDDLILPEIYADDECYILYTSGSTGTPKGIVHTHKSAVSFAIWGKETFDIESCDTLSNHAPYHFDLSTFDLFASCAAGATTVIFPEFLTKFPTSMASIIEERQITIWYSVPSALIQMMVKGGLENVDTNSLRCILFAGEEFPIKQLQKLRKVLPNVRLSNLYGPTETNVCTYYDVGEEVGNTPLPIGKPCEGFEGLLIDEDGNEVLQGEVGELVVAGPHVMEMYWNRDQLNSEKFIHVKNHQNRYYKTGDLARLLEDGNYCFLGRKDRQIKIRGYRVELDEIEYEVQNFGGVLEGIVIASNQSEETFIQATIIPERGQKLEEKQIINYLRSKLPPYAVPSKINIVKTLPRTSSGKVDRKLLEHSQGLR